MAAITDDDLLVTEPAGPARATLILAHGAGGGMQSHPLDFFADSLAAQGIRTVRFEFPYMRRRRTEGRRGAPDPPAALQDSWREVIDKVSQKIGGEPGTSQRQPSLFNIFIGGKSMGGRIASMVADEATARGQIRGLICLGYPFHPPGKPQQLRVAHLKGLETPALILQGERDPFGVPEEVPGYELSPRIRVVWIPDGNHSFKPRKQSGRTERQNLDLAVSEMVAFIFGLTGELTGGLTGG